MEQRYVTVVPDNITRVNLTLRVGGVNQSVVVQAQEVRLQTDSAEVRHDLNTQELRDLPTPPGRNYENLLVMVPGSSPPQSIHSIATNASRAISFYVNGGSRFSNNVRVDGTTINSVFQMNISAITPALEATVANSCPIASRVCIGNSGNRVLSRRRASTLNRSAPGMSMLCRLSVPWIRFLTLVRR